MIDGCRSGNKTRGGDKNQKRGERMERERGSCIRVRDVCASVRVCGNIYCPAEVGGSDLLLISGEASELCVLWVYGNGKYAGVEGIRQDIWAKEWLR